ncbi:hypothetical protein H0H92_001425 [Tricholoma furcatifolium]|nr:hypothetical protein H0H92_001425 [Tricholoma furcatifolium]
MSHEQRQRHAENVVKRDLSVHTTVESAIDAFSNTTTTAPDKPMCRNTQRAPFRIVHSEQIEWDHHVPQIAFIVTYLLAVVLFLAVGIMLSYHLWSISSGETTVEAQDHEVYSKKARSRGEMFVNSYDLGRKRNLQLFFNIGEAGYPVYTLFVPFRIMPYTDGRSWARKEGYDRHYGVRRGEELTDEEESDDV